MKFIEEALATLEAKGRLRIPTVIEQRRGARVVVDGQELINVSSNDYLGLATHPALIEAARAAMAEHGVGAGASRLVTGNVEEAVRLEEELARFHRAESARLFSSGYAANTGMVPIVAERGDAVFSDELNHASIIDGCRLSRAEVHVYRHGDVNHLEDLLRKSTARRKLVVTESLFSMDGDIAPLADIRSIAPMLMVDEAHAVGALGDGRGLSVDADVVVGTLGKAFGSAGAYVLGSRALSSMVWNRARSLVFSTGLPVPVLAAARAALSVIASDEGAALRARLRSHAERLGCDSHIIPIILGEDRRAMDAMRWFMDRGWLVQGIRPPTVPEGTARLRLSLSAALTDSDLSALLDLLPLVPRGT